MSSALDDALCKLKATVAASTKSASLKLDRVGRKKRFIELAAPILDVSSKRCRWEPTSAHQSAGDATKQEKAEKETTTDLRVDVEYYQNLIDQCEKEDQKQREEGAKSLESVRELRRVYLYGLQKISKLQDLREAPDAIMPGNFMVEKKACDEEKKVPA